MAISPHRRAWLTRMLASAGRMPWALSGVSTASQAAPASGPTAPAHCPDLRPDMPLRFPRDFGAHPGCRFEWWYITGALQAPRHPKGFGFQLTFFRSRVDGTEASHSRFAARHLVLSHAALTDLGTGRFLHDQRVARMGFGVVAASEADTDVRLRDWRLQRRADAAVPDHGVYESHIPARDFTLDLRFATSQPLMLQGQAGFFRKGAEPGSATRYYSEPQLETLGVLTYRSERIEVTGRAWLDREWGDVLLPEGAQGWDWIGMNLHDGAALMALRMRTKDGGTLWSGGGFRRPGQPVQAFPYNSVRMTPRRIWTSPATAGRYPVEWLLETPAGRFSVHAAIDAQEMDARASTGNIYWEGLSLLRDEQGREAGRGYLEMTGYAGQGQGHR